MLIPAVASRSIESNSNREAAHHFTLGADIVLFGTVIWYVGRTAYEKVLRSPVPRWGPFMAVSLACTLLILDPLRHILLDHGGVFFKERTLAMYDNHGLSPVGQFCQISSIAGLILLLSGVLWHMRVPEALLSKLCNEVDCKSM